MATKPKRKRTKVAGFVGVSLAKGGDMTLYNRFMEEVGADPELDQSKLIRIALKDYFDKIDSLKTN